MKAFGRIIVISLVSIIVLLSAVNCSAPESSGELEKALSELNDCQQQIAELQEKLATTTLKSYQDLNDKYQELEGQYEAKTQEIQAVKAEFEDAEARYQELQEEYEAKNDELQAAQAEYDNLAQEFEELKTQYDLLIQTPVFTEEEIEEAIFVLVNEERANNGVEPLLWGKHLNSWARENSREMADRGEYLYSEWASWQEIFWATGYGDLDRLAAAALTTWKTNDYRYNYNIINVQSQYGAVGVYKSGEIFYITYMASISQ